MASSTAMASSSGRVAVGRPASAASPAASRLTSSWPASLVPMVTSAGRGGDRVAGGRLQLLQWQLAGERPAAALVGGRKRWGRGVAGFPQQDLEGCGAELHGLHRRRRQAGALQPSGHGPQGGVQEGGRLRIGGGAQTLLDAGGGAGGQADAPTGLPVALLAAP